MLTAKEYMAVRALRAQGWSVSAIARKLGRDRKTVRSYLGGERVAGLRSPAQDVFLRFLPYCRLRLADDAHLPATVLFDEVVELGYPGRYSTFTRSLRKHRLRPPCGLCRRAPAAGGPTAVPRQPGEEMWLGWLRLPDPPSRWGGGPHAHVLIGTLPYADRWRGVLAENEEFPQLVEALDQVLRRLGGTARLWRLDRMPTVCHPATSKVTPAFARVARYYGVGVDRSPHQGDQVGLRDQELRTAVFDWWRTVVGDTRLQAAQDSLDRLAAWMDGRHCVARDALAAADPTEPQLLELPAAPFPARVCATRTVSSQGLVPFRGNLYAVPPDLAGAVVEVRWRLDEPHLSIATARGAVIARHTLAPRGASRTVIHRTESIALERPPQAVRTDTRPCPGNTRRPPSPAALAEADALRERVPAQRQRAEQDGAWAAPPAPPAPPVRPGRMAEPLEGLS